MANGKENLIPFNELTKEEQRKIASNGGKKSVEVRREKKLLTGALLELLKKGETIQGINTALVEKAQSGDTKAYEVIRDSIGEKPTDKQEVIGVVGNVEATDQAFNELMEKMKR